MGIAKKEVRALIRVKKKGEKMKKNRLITIKNEKGEYLEMKVMLDEQRDQKARKEIKESFKRKIKETHLNDEEDGVALQYIYEDLSVESQAYVRPYLEGGYRDLTLGPLEEAVGELQQEDKEVFMVTTNFEGRTLFYTTDYKSHADYIEDRVFQRFVFIESV